MSNEAPAPRSDPFSLTGKVCIVTGGAGLYGRHISHALAARGATVVIAARDATACHSVAEESCSLGGDAWAHRLDLGDEDSIRELCAEVLRREGRVDVLVNNSVARAGGHFSETSGSAWEETARINGTGLFLITKHVVQEMTRGSGGSIVNVASIYGIVGPDFSVYGDTGMTTPPSYAYDKGGMIAFTRYLATLLGPEGIRVNSLTLGGLHTEQDERFVGEYIARTPLRRMAGPDDVKGAVVYLASDASAYVTGTNLVVDGGWTAQ